MKVWSKGLGKIELILDFKTYYVESEKKEDEEYVYIKGVITDPVIWDFRITMTKEDIPGLLNIAINRTIIFMFLKNLKLSISSAFKQLFGKSDSDKDKETKGAIEAGDKNTNDNK